MFTSLLSFKLSSVPTPDANIVTSICLFVSFIISTAFSVETDAALRNCPAKDLTLGPLSRGEPHGGASRKEFVAFERGEGAVM